MPLPLRRQTDQQFGHPVIAVVDQQALRRLGRQHPLGQHHLRFAIGPQRGRQRIVQSQFHHHRHADLRKRRPPPPTPAPCAFVSCFAACWSPKTSCHPRRTNAAPDKTLRDVVSARPWAGALASIICSNTAMGNRARRWASAPSVMVLPVICFTCWASVPASATTWKIKPWINSHALTTGGQRRRTPQRRSKV